MARQIECAVCGKAVDPLNIAFTATDDAQLYYFCSSTCRDALLSDPRRYLGRTGS